MSKLQDFTSQIPGFANLTLSVQLDCFAYHLAVNEGRGYINPKDLGVCFTELGLPPYSNIPRYLKTNSKRSGTKQSKYFKTSLGYSLTPRLKEEILSGLLMQKKPIIPSNELYPTELFKESRRYVAAISEQAAICFDEGLYDACSVMLRRLTETLIIEAFERKGIESQIKDSSGNYFYLRDLINICISNTQINLSRNSKRDLPTLKDLGDLSAHSRRYLAKKSDIDCKRSQMRIVFEELLHIIDYPSWR